jgi:uncharacterized membrane protein
MPLAHIHPMIVHFPIVLFLALVLLDVLVLGSGGSLTARQTLPRLALGTLLAGLAATAIAVVFGGIAGDIATGNGFPVEPIDAHEEMAMLTFYVFAAAAALRLFCYWRRIDLGGARGWAAAAIGLAGVVLIVVTAQRGGHLVYDLGVNVASIKG